jgi:hypothetical protein
LRAGKMSPKHLNRATQSSLNDAIRCTKKRASRRLKTHPLTRIEVGSQTIDVVAEEATGDNRQRLFAKAAERYLSLAEMAHNTRRVIPLLS